MSKLDDFNLSDEELELMNDEFEDVRPTFTKEQVIITTHFFHRWGARMKKHFSDSDVEDLKEQIVEHSLFNRIGKDTDIKVFVCGRRVIVNVGYDKFGEHLCLVKTVKDRSPFLVKGNQKTAHRNRKTINRAFQRKENNRRR